jgi:pSer/pThr/pTyr-binding forkhead associated (FHA) protein
MESGTPGSHPRPVRRQATVLESVEEIRDQIRAAAVPKSPGASASALADSQVETQPFRPAVRPPMGLLCVLDDGEDAGELVRIRTSTFVIGRVEGDLVIPHDSGISGRHAEIIRRVEDGTICWCLRDLQSTNGTFVRVSTVVLHHEQELLIGGRLFRFDAPGRSPEAELRPVAQEGVTRKWETPARGSKPPTTPPALVELSQGQEGRRFALTEREHWLGRDDGLCGIVVNEPTVDRRHARVYRDVKTERWVVVNERSRNGLWARIHEVNLGRGGSFQCGEQRFSFKVL